MHSNYKNNLIRFLIALSAFAVCLYASIHFLDIAIPQTHYYTVWVLVPFIVLAAFLFQTMDTVAGMGLGTALSPLLFAAGYDALSIVPTLLFCQAFTGFLSGWLHNELGNVHLSPRSSRSILSGLLLVAGTGIIAIAASIYIVYGDVEPQDKVIETYVAVLVMAMGVFIFLKRPSTKERASSKNVHLLGFSLLAAVNKGVGGGGYGPVVTMGAVISGYKDKESVALTVLAEGIVSLAGIIIFFVLMTRGLQINYQLLPSVLTGGFFGALIAPYFIKICPPSILHRIIPTYAIIIGLFVLAKLYLF